MRVAFIVDGFPVISQTFILNQIVGLIERGHTVDIYSINLTQEEADTDTAKMHPDVEKYNLLNRTYYSPKIPKNPFLRLLKAIVLSASFYKSPLVWLQSLNIFKYGTQAASLRLLYRATHLINKEPYDIIHCQFGTLALPIMVQRQLGAIRGKLVTSFRGYDISEIVQQKGENVYKELFKTGDFFLTNCNYFKNRLLKLGCPADKLLVLGSGIDCSKFAYTPRTLPADNIVRIATTGRLVEKKGIEYCIRAVAKVIEANKKIEYNIIGDGILKAQLQQLIEELGISNKVKILGWQPQQEIIKILHQSSIFMATSLTASNGNQDAPVNTLKEAMAMGMPVIGTLHGGIPELIEDGISGFLVPEKDVDALAEKLIWLIENPSDWIRMGKAGRAYVEKHYETNQLNHRLVEIYHQVLT
ncbi:MAG: glycosyltransferase [Chroococcus sp. CMT-3BRIN-NPC107]|jgi:colanic acid/amylovoran biosynthesis glycosyltransferase|nr:glycosyltransferase [Chroococcus sp. CMT-3BRIN-NPC107]